MLSSRKDHGRIVALPGHEHVVAPDEEADYGDADARPGHGLVAENVLAREAGNDLANDAHPRKIMM